MANRERIITRDPQTKESGSVSAYVVEARNHLLQDRSFAFDGRDWFYQPDRRSPYQKVGTSDVPDDAVQKMAAHTGLSENTLRGVEEEDDEEEDLDIRYRCPDCGNQWEEVYPSACDSECGNCGLENIEALQWKGLDEDWTPEQEEEWASCAKCVCGHAREDHYGHDKEGVPGKCRKRKAKCEGYEVDMSRYTTK